MKWGGGTEWRSCRTASGGVRAGRKGKSQAGRSSWEEDEWEKCKKVKEGEEKWRGDRRDGEGEEDYKGERIGDGWMETGEGDRDGRKGVGVVKRGAMEEGEVNVKEQGDAGARGVVGMWRGGGGGSRGK